MPRRLTLIAPLGIFLLMKPRVYIETTIPSFYHEIRTEPDMVARRQWTRQWWKTHREFYEPVTSIAVIDELEQGSHPKQKECLSLIRAIPILPVTKPIAEIIQTYIDHNLMPNDPKGDALHLALASVHRCQFLLTWNCLHLANANKREHIRHVNTLLGLHVPMLATPMELVREQDGAQ